MGDRYCNQVFQDSFYCGSLGKGGGGRFSPEFLFVDNRAIQEDAPFFGKGYGTAIIPKKEDKSTPIVVLKNLWFVYGGRFVIYTIGDNKPLTGGVLRWIRWGKTFENTV